MFSIVVLLLFVACLLVIGFVAGQRTGEGAKEFFIGGRSLGAITLGLSGSATANTGFVVVGAVGMGYGLGLQSLLYAFAWLLGDIIFWFFLAKKLVAKTKQTDAVTVVDILKSRGPRIASLSIFCALIIASMLIVYTAAQFIAAGKTAAEYFSVSTTLAVIASAIGVSVYTMFGGFRSSVWTDVLQSWLMILLAGITLFWVWIIKAGPSEVIMGWKNLDPSFLSFSNGASTTETLALFLGFSFVAIGYNLSQPQLTTRIMAAKEESTINSARIIYISSLQFVWISMCLIGMIAKIYLPDLSDPERALPYLAANHMMVVSGSLVIVGMFAAILSSIDSLLLASSSALSVDILKNRGGKWGFRASVLLCALIAATMGLFLSSTVFDTSVFAATILSVTIGVAVFIVITGINHTNTSLFMAMIGGLLSSFIWKYAPTPGMISDPMFGWLSALIINWVWANYIEKKSSS